MFYHNYTRHLWEGTIDCGLKGFSCEERSRDNEKENNQEYRMRKSFTRPAGRRNNNF